MITLPSILAAFDKEFEHKTGCVWEESCDCGVDDMKVFLAKHLESYGSSERMAGREEGLKEGQKWLARYGRMIELMADGMSYDEAFSSTKPE